jgi:hypothetical protein
MFMQVWEEMRKQKEEVFKSLSGLVRKQVGGGRRILPASGLSLAVLFDGSR